MPLSSLAEVASITYRSVSCGSLAIAQGDELEATAPGASGLRYSTTDQAYAFNWAAPRSPGCYSLIITLRAGGQQLAHFQLR